jgi:hypothetical protein
MRVLGLCGGQWRPILLLESTGKLSDIGSNRFCVRVPEGERPGVNVMINTLGDFYRFLAIFTDFWQFLPIFGDFYRFSAIFTDFRRILPFFGDFYRFSAFFTDF